MPLVIDGHQIPPRWAETRTQQRTVSIDSYVRRADCIQIAFVNNMPDPALEDTEVQFFELLNSVAGKIPLRVTLYSLPGIPRTDRGRQHLRSFYVEFDDLWKRRFDGVIVTGTEPCSPTLRDEPYWPALSALLDWAEHNTVSAILSCLAAHASALHSDGIERHRLTDKRFGVFDVNTVSEHLLTRNTGRIRFPHSRWNDIAADALTASGYVVLTQSEEAGADTFVKVKKNSLFVHFQGHPEYHTATLLKEYRRDIKRFLRRERSTYPSLPHCYFNAAATRLLTEFRDKAIFEHEEGVMTAFPEAAVAAQLQNGWHTSAQTIYRNWLEQIESRKLRASTFMALSSVPGRAHPVQLRRAAGG